MEVRNALVWLAETIERLSDLEMDDEVEISISLSLPREDWLIELPLVDGLEASEPDEIVHFQYGSDLDRRVGRVIRHNEEKRMTLVFDFAKNAPRNFQWDKVYTPMVIEENNGC